MHFTPPLIDRCRADVAALIQALTEGAGLPPTFITVFALGDAKFVKSHAENNFTIGTYDQFVSRLAAVWPDDKVKWPLFTRPAPAPVSDEDRATFKARLEKVLAQREVERQEAALKDARAKAKAAKEAAKTAGSPTPTTIKETTAHG